MSTNSKPLALIVGGTSGIGLATAKQLAQQDINTVVIGRSQPMDKLNNIEFLQGDLYKESDLNRIINFIEEEKRSIKYMVNAAGYFNPTPFLDHKPSDYDTYMDLNRSTFFISQAVAKRMVKDGGGSIVHIGSMWAKQAIKATPSSAYSMAKAGLHSLTQHMAMELAGSNIRVNAVSPAVVKTPIYEAFIDPNEIDNTLSSFNEFHPIGRIGTPEDVSNVIEFLLSKESSWITGTVVDVDGGVMAGRN